MERNLFEHLKMCVLFLTLGQVFTPLEARTTNQVCRPASTLGWKEDGEPAGRKPGENTGPDQFVHRPRYLSGDMSTDGNSLPEGREYWRLNLGLNHQRFYC